MNLWFLRLYILLLLSVIGIALIDLPWKIDADMYSVLPSGHSLKDVGAAEQKWSKNISANFMLLLSGKDFDKAKNAALLLHGKFAKEPSLEKFEIFTDSNAVQDLRNFLFENKMRLQTKEFVQTLNTNASRIQQQAFSKIYGVNPLVSLENLDEDPFLLSENGIESIMGNQAIGTWEIRDNLRVAKDGNGNSYILITGKLSEDVSSFAGKKNIISRIKEEAKAMEKELDLHIAFSGIPFHINESSGNAQREVAAITALSMLSVILLLFFAFRSGIPLIAAVGVILISVLFAASAVQIIFERMHIFTFVFGTSIIGLSLDYSIHFFSHWKVATANENGFGIRSKIILCLFFGFLTTQLGYIALMATRFPLLVQIAAFSFFGLLCAFLSVYILFPYFKLPPQNKRILHIAFVARFFLAVKEYFAGSKIMRTVVLALLAGAFVLGLMNFKIENNLKDFYSMSKELQYSEKLSAEIMNAGTGLFYIVWGSSPEEVLESEEELGFHLDTLCSYLAVSTFVPSAKSQIKVYNSINKNLLPLYNEQFMQLGFDSLTAKTKAISLREKFQKEKDKILDLNSEFPETIRQTIDKLWLGKIDGKYYSVVLILKTKDRDSLKKIQANNAILVDKVGEIGNELTVISKKIILMMLIAYAISLLFLSFAYKFKEALKILATPLLASAISASAISLLGFSMSFFAISGTILTLAIGIDYSLFFSKGSGDGKITFFAVFLSMLSTVLSFGLLSLSSFAPVSHLGLSVSIGIIACFLLSFFLFCRYER
jgi:predicted exporter